MAGGTTFAQYNNGRRFLFVLLLFVVTLILRVINVSVRSTGRKSIHNLQGEKSDDSSSSSSSGKNDDSSAWKFTGDDDPTLPKPWIASATKWWNVHKTLVQEVKSVSQPDLIFYGDSITESWRGETFGSLPEPGRKWKQGEALEIRTLFNTYFGNNALALGISGDQTQHLLWRMQNGEFPVAFNSSTLFVVMIGTNNIGGGTLPDDTVRGIDAVARYILQHGGRHLLLNQVLPRYDSQRVQRLCPPRCHKDGKPFQSFLPAIAKVNEALPTVCA